MAFNPNELRLKDGITDALDKELRKIDDEIRELRRNRRELKLTVRRAQTVGREAYRLMSIKGERAAKAFAFRQRVARSIVHKVLDLCGAHHLYCELSSMFVDTWVTLGRESDEPPQGR